VRREKNRVYGSHTVSGPRPTPLDRKYNARSLKGQPKRKTIRHSARPSRVVLRLSCQARLNGLFRSAVHDCWAGGPPRRVGVVLVVGGGVSRVVDCYYYYYLYYCCCCC